MTILVIILTIVIALEAIIIFILSQREKKYKYEIVPTEQVKLINFEEHMRIIINRQPYTNGTLYKVHFCTLDGKILFTKHFDLNLEESIAVDTLKPNEGFTKNWQNL